MGKEVCRDELSKGSYTRGNLSEFLYEIHFILPTFFCQFNIRCSSGKLTQVKFSKELKLSGRYCRGGGGGFPQERFSMGELQAGETFHWDIGRVEFP